VLVDRRGLEVLGERGPDGLGVLVAQLVPGKLDGGALSAAGEVGDPLECAADGPLRPGAEPGEVDGGRVEVGALDDSGQQVAAEGRCGASRAGLYIQRRYIL